MKINPFDPGFFYSEDLKTLGFKFIGENVSIAKNTTIVGLNNISIGNNVRIDSGTLIVANTGSLSIENYVHISAHCHLACAGGILMKSFSGLSQGVKIFTITDNLSEPALTNPTTPKKYFKPKVDKVELSKHVIIGTGSVIMPGVTIGEGSAVGALSYVNKSLGSWGIFGGIPAKKLKERDKALLDREKEINFNSN